MDPELRSVLRRYLLVGIVLAASVAWAVIYTTMKTSAPATSPAPAQNGAPATTEAATAAKATAEATDEAARQPEKRAERKAPSLGALLVSKDGAQRVACEPACRLEEYCDLRDAASCLQTSCDGDVRKLSTSDFPFARAETCAAAAAAPCAEACWKKGECAGDHGDDTRCTNACLTLVTQRPAETFRESRCLIESRCTELPLCIHVER